MLSYSPDRSWPAILNKQSLDHNVYIYYPASPTVAKVVFAIDGKIFRTETSAAWDLAGTATGGKANVFSPKTLTAGAHTLSATVTTTSKVVLKTQATFYVPASVAKPKAVAATAKLVGVSKTASGKAVAKLSGATVKGKKYIVLAVAPGSVRAEFILDGKVVRLLRSGAGGRSSSAPLTTAKLHKGKHRLVVRMVAKNGQVSVATASFKIV
jgi:hypothetical protein